MNLSSEEYFFYEWLIIVKNYTEEKLKLLTPKEFENLKNEYIKLDKQNITIKLI